MNHKFEANKDDYVNILWYEGSDDQYHYFGYVYGYAFIKRKNYRIQKREIDIKQEFKLTEYSTQWIKVLSINNKWFSRYKEDGVWEKDTDDGIRIYDKAKEEK